MVLHRGAGQCCGKGRQRNSKGRLGPHGRATPQNRELRTSLPGEEEHTCTGSERRCPKQDEKGDTYKHREIRNTMHTTTLKQTGINLDHNV